MPAHHARAHRLEPAASVNGRFGDQVRTHHRQKHNIPQIGSHRPAGCISGRKLWPLPLSFAVTRMRARPKCRAQRTSGRACSQGSNGASPCGPGRVACLLNVRAASMASAHCGPTAAQRRLHRVAYFSVMASPLRSTFASKPTCLPVSSSTAPFWFVSTIPRAPVPTASPAPAAP
jgi:hypothetical protein